MGYPKITYRSGPKAPSKHWDGPVEAIGVLSVIAFMLVLSIIFKREL